MKELLEIFSSEGIKLAMHAHGGDEFVTKERIPTKVRVSDCEIQVWGSNRQKIGISRQHGYLAVHFWLTGNPDNSGPDKVAILMENGFTFGDWSPGYIEELYREQ